jgi:hypothetical protein
VGDSWEGEGRDNGDLAGKLLVELSRDRSWGSTCLINYWGEVQPARSGQVLIALCLMHLHMPGRSLGNRAISARRIQKDILEWRCNCNVENHWPLALLAYFEVPSSLAWSVIGGCSSVVDKTCVSRGGGCRSRGVIAAGTASATAAAAVAAVAVAAAGAGAGAAAGGCAAAAAAAGAAAAGAVAAGTAAAGGAAVAASASAIAAVAVVSGGTGGAGARDAVAGAPAAAAGSPVSAGAVGIAAGLICGSLHRRLWRFRGEGRECLEVRLPLDWYIRDREKILVDSDQSIVRLDPGRLLPPTDVKVVPIYIDIMGCGTSTVTHTTFRDKRVGELKP